MKINGILISSTSDEHGPIYVYENRTSRILSFDDEVYQSYMKLRSINRLDLVYTQAMMTGLFFVANVKTATIMGLGAGSMAKNLLNTYPKLEIHAIEYRKAVIQIAKDYFYLPESDHLFIHNNDAAKHIKHTLIKSDIIFSDLYNSKGMDPQQVQLNYLNDCKNALTEQGILVLNIWHTGLQSKKEIDELLEQEFKNRLLSFDVKGGNTIILAFKNDIPSLTKIELLNKAKYLQEKMSIPMEDYVEVLWASQHH